MNILSSSKQTKKIKIIEVGQGQAVTAENDGGFGGTGMGCGGCDNVGAKKRDNCKEGQNTVTCTQHRYVRRDDQFLNSS